jgi:hypothetical protein
MDPEIKAKWVEALRSGEYTQGRGSLKDNYDGDIKHCCMGVLAEVAGLELTPEETTSSSTRWLFMGDQGYLSDPTLKSLGLDYGIQSVLIAKNDTSSTFEDIADYIDQHL